MLGQFGQAAARGNRDDLARFGRAFKRCCLLYTSMLIGSSAGSTGGGIKVVRLQLLCKSMVREIRRTVHPRSVNTIRFDGRAVDESVISSTLAFFFAYILSLIHI